MKKTTLEFCILSFMTIVCSCQKTEKANLDVFRSLNYSDSAACLRSGTSENLKKSTKFCHFWFLSHQVVIASLNIRVSLGFLRNCKIFQITAFDLGFYEISLRLLRFAVKRYFIINKLIHNSKISVKNNKINTYNDFKLFG